MAMGQFTIRTIKMTMITCMKEIIRIILLINLAVYISKREDNLQF